MRTFVLTKDCHFDTEIVMRTLTLNIPEIKHQQLQQLAQNQNMRLDTLLDEMTSKMLQEFALKEQFSRFLGKPVWDAT